MFGTVGGLVEYRAALLASRGFVTLALAYFWPSRGMVDNLEYFEVFHSSPPFLLYFDIFTNVHQPQYLT